MHGTHLNNGNACKRMLSDGNVPSDPSMSEKSKASGAVCARKHLCEQTVKNICIMTYLFNILSQLWIPIHVVTPAAPVQCLPSATRCQDVSQEPAPKLWGRQRATGASRARQSGLLSPSGRRQGVWQTVERNEHWGGPRRGVCSGIRAPTNLVLLQTPLSYSQGVRRGKLSVGLCSSAQSPQASPCN